MRRLLSWLAALAILVVVFGTIYGTVQQSQRSAANSPQIQLAEDTAAALNAGDPPLVLVHSSVNIAKSLAPFTTIYDKSGNVVISSGYLNGKPAKAPVGILTAANGQTYHAITWQPQDNVRIAAVTVAAKNYYVLSGRSLTEVEKNEDRAFRLSFIGGIVSLILLAIAFIGSSLRRRY